MILQARFQYSIQGLLLQLGRLMLKRVRVLFSPHMAINTIRDAYCDISSAEIDGYLLSLDLFSQRPFGPDCKTKLIYPLLLFLDIWDNPAHFKCADMGGLQIDL